MCWRYNLITAFKIFIVTLLLLPNGFFLLRLWLIIAYAAAREELFSSQVYRAKTVRNRSSSSSSFTELKASPSSFMEIALAQKWEDLLQLANSLHELAASLSWQDLAHLAHRCRELAETDERGRTPLHIACSSPSAGFVILKALLEASVDIALVTDHEGSMPLHCLLKSGSPSDEALELVIRYNPNAITHSDKHDRTALSHAIQNNLSMSGLKIVINYMSESHPDNILQHILQPFPLMDKRRQSVNMSTKNLDENKPSGEKQKLDAKSSSPLYIAWKNTLYPLDGSEYKIKGKLWEKAHLLLSKAYKLKHPDREFRSIPALLEFLPYVPIDRHDFVYTFTQHHCMTKIDQFHSFSLEKAISRERSDGEEMYLMDQLLRNHLILKSNLLTQTRISSQQTLIARFEGFPIFNTNNQRPKKKLSLLQLAFSGRLKQLAKLAPCYPEELFHRNENNVIPLHAACSSSAVDLSVIKALVMAAPHTATLVDNEGSTPLHYLLYYGPPKKLLTGVVRFMIEAYPEALTQRDIYGRTPLFHAIEMNQRLDIVKTITEYPGAADSILLYCGSELGMLKDYQDPRHSRGSLFLFSRYRLSQKHTERTPLYMAWRNALEPLGVPASEFRTRGCRWAKAMLLLQIAYSKRYPGQSFQPLHSLIEFLPYLPVTVFTFLFALAEHDCFMRATDSRNRLPLHIASSSDVAEDHKIIALVEKLLNYHPEAIRYGRLPFHEAVASGKSWKICKKLLEVHPIALDVADVVTGLYPFMLAACTSEDTSRAPTLDALYEMILMNPSLVEVLWHIFNVK